MLVDPLALAAEAGHLAALGVPDALARLTVDRDALLTTPYHRAANQTRELARGQDRHGRWQGVFRTGHFDAVALGYAVEVARRRGRRGGNAPGHGAGPARSAVPPV